MPWEQKYFYAKQLKNSKCIILENKTDKLNSEYKITTYGKKVLNPDPHPKNDLMSLKVLGNIIPTKFLYTPLHLLLNHTIKEITVIIL